MSSIVSLGLLAPVVCLQRGMIDLLVFYTYVTQEIAAAHAAALALKLRKSNSTTTGPPGSNEGNMEDGRSSETGSAKDDNGNDSEVLVDKSYSAMGGNLKEHQKSRKLGPKGTLGIIDSIASNGDDRGRSHSYPSDFIEHTSSFDSGHNISPERDAEEVLRLRFNAAILLQ